MKYFLLFILLQICVFSPLSAATFHKVTQEISFSNQSLHNVKLNIDEPTPPIQVEWKKAMILACFIFVGIGGLHRLYMGYRKEGIIQFATIGLGGIWQIIDIARMITGELKPKNGEFTKPDKTAKPDKAKRNMTN
ncbi:MAG: TM2 domain-containing protein [Bacteroidia bacterium]